MTNIPPGRSSQDERSRSATPARIQRYLADGRTAPPALDTPLDPCAAPRAAANARPADRELPRCATGRSGLQSAPARGRPRLRLTAGAPRRKYSQTAANTAGRQSIRVRQTNQQQTTKPIIRLRSLGGTWCRIARCRHRQITTMGRMVIVPWSVQRLMALDTSRFRELARRALCRPDALASEGTDWRPSGGGSIARSSPDRAAARSPGVEMAHRTTRIGGTVQTLAAGSMPLNPANSR